MNVRETRSIASAAFLVVSCAGLALYQPAGLISVLRRVFPGTLWSASGIGNRVAVTFDDGPDVRYTPQVLDILRAHDAKGTFFLIGSEAQARPALVKRIKSEGHLIGNHLWVDEYVLFKNEADLSRELLNTEQVLQIADTPKYVRPPRILFGPAFRRVAEANGYQIVMGSAYVSDPYRPPAQYIRWAMERMLRPGAILVLHDGGGNRENTLAALPDILATGARRGLQFVTLAELFDGNQR